MSIRPLPLILLTFLLAVSAGAADWPQIRGPERDGRSPETGLLHAWPEDGPRLVWRQPIGAAFSGVSVAEGRLFTGTSDAEKEYLVALDPASGEELWRRELGPLFTHNFGDGPRSTPTVDDGVVYVLGANGRLAAFAAADGEAVWQVDLGETFGAEQPRFGWSASPLVDGDLLLIETGGPDGKNLAALDKRTGETRWTALDGPAAYSSPVVMEIDGVRQYVFFRRAEPEIVSLSVDGEVLWTHKGLAALIVMPLLVPPDGVFLSSTHAAEGFLLRVGAGDGEPVLEEVWRTPRMRNHFNTSVVVDGHIYGFDNATFKAIDAATGEQAWAYRGFGKGSLIEADGHLYVLSDVGVAALVEATPEAYREKGRFQAMTGKAWTPPSLADGRLYLRDQDEIAAFDVAGAADVLARHLEARGGRERWRAVEALEARGFYTAFSHREPFTLLNKGRDLYRFEAVVLGNPTVYARGPDGPWWIEPMLGAEEAAPPAEGYVRQLDRAFRLTPGLLLAAERGYSIEPAGPGEVDGVETVTLRVTPPGGEGVAGEPETWHLDPVTFLEVAVDSRVLDYTQAEEPIDQRAYFSDFREVDGLVLPHRVEREYLSRHTVLEIEEVTVDPPLDDERFR